jgi:DNA-binding response OmpR family regulator
LDQAGKASIRGENAVSIGSVLVMETNSSIAPAISKMVEQARWNTVLSFSLDMALGMMASNKVHLLLFDCLPNNDEITKTVNAVKVKPNTVPLALMPDSRFSRAPISNFEGIALESGAEFFMPKPFTPERLKQVLAQTVKLLRARKTNKHVKIIEDNAALRLGMAQALQKMGFEVSQAGSMEEAYGQSDMIDVDVAVTDIFMPGMGGIEGILSMRRDWPHVKIIAISETIEGQMSSTKILAAARQIGASETMAKPFSPDELIAAVKRQFVAMQAVAA